MAMKMDPDFFDVVDVDDSSDELDYIEPLESSDHVAYDGLRPYYNDDDSDADLDDNYDYELYGDMNKPDPRYTHPSATPLQKSSVGLSSHSSKPHQNERHSNSMYRSRARSDYYDLSPSSRKSSANSTSSKFQSRHPSQKSGSLKHPAGSNLDPYYSSGSNSSTSNQGRHSSSKSRYNNHSSNSSRYRMDDHEGIEDTSHRHHQMPRKKQRPLSGSSHRFSSSHSALGSSGSSKDRSLTSSSSSRAPISQMSLADRRAMHNVQEQNRRLAIKRLLKRMQTMYPERLKCDVLGDAYTQGQDLTNPQTMRCLERYVKEIAEQYEDLEYLKDEIRRTKQQLGIPESDPPIMPHSD